GPAPTIEHRAAAPFPAGGDTTCSLEQGETNMMRMHLRNAAAALALAVLLPAGMAAAQSGWQKKYPVVKYGVIPVETQTGTTKTMDAFLRHAEKVTGVKWELYQATDYSGVMNALIAGQINLAWLSGFSYC